MEPSPTLAPGTASTRARAPRIAALLALPVLLALAGVPSACADPSGDVSGGIAAAQSSANAATSVSLPGVARSSERLFGLPGLSNIGRVAPGILRGAQPAPEGYETLRRMGIRTVVNLRLRHGEKEAVEAAGMRSVEIPFDTMKSVDPAKVARVLDVMTDPRNRPLFVHCAQGKDRTGLVVAVYRIKVDGWSREEAEAEMDAFGFHDAWIQFRKFVRRYPLESANGAGKAGP